MEESEAYKEMMERCKVRYKDRQGNEADSRYQKNC